uniref:F-box domain-containing protein n=1 Tax=Aegilops tauschii TaxID=37682 RepID=M8CF48_AEGTA
MDIFARLPAKFVGRCRYLSRAWAAMLSSEDFADRHRRLANHRHSPRVFFLHHSSRDGPLMHVWSPQDSPNGAPLTLYVPKADNAKRALHIATLVCRGLAIFQTPCTEINYLCNPLTGQMAALPEREKMPWYWDDVLGRHYTSLGLGYDAHMKKHEVVCVYYGGARCDSEGLPRFAGCDLYVVNSNGRWPIQGKPPAWNLHWRLDMSKVSPDMTNRFVKWPNPLVTINNGSRILLVRPRSLAHENNYSRMCAYDPMTGDVEDMFSGSDMVYDSITSTTDAAVYEESIVSPRWCGPFVTYDGLGKFLESYGVGWYLFLASLFCFWRARLCM